MLKRNLLVIGLSTLLGACGFHLRGTGSDDFALSEINVTARNAYGPLAKEVEKSLENSGVNVHAGAPYTLVLANERQSQRSASYTSSARSAEIQLTSGIDYEIRGANNLLLMNNQLEVQSYYAQDGNNLAGSDQEAAQQRDEMRHDLVRQLSQRLQRITPAELDQLQQTAEANAQAQADALEASKQNRAAQPQQSPVQIDVPATAP